MTRAQMLVLQDAERMPALGLDGVLGKGPRMRSIRALRRAGLLRYAGRGVDSDGDDREWPIYEITDAGRAVLAAPRKCPCDGTGTMHASPAPGESYPVPCPFCTADHAPKESPMTSRLPPEIREILRDVAHGVHGPDLSGRAAAAIVKRDLCPRCANTGHELLDAPGTLMWGTCHGCSTPPPAPTTEDRSDD